MTPADVRDTDVLTIWNKMREKADKTRRLQAQISGGPARTRQQGEDEIRERRRTKLYQDFQST